MDKCCQLSLAVTCAVIKNRPSLQMKRCKCLNDCKRVKVLGIKMVPPSPAVPWTASVLLSFVVFDAEKELDYKQLIINSRVTRIANFFCPLPAMLGADQEIFFRILFSKNQNIYIFEEFSVRVLLFCLNLSKIILT